MLEPADAYARWAPCYPAEAHNTLMAIEEAAVVDLLPPTPGPALDLACGTGRYANVLRARGVVSVFGLDRSPEMLQRAKQGGRPHFALVRGDLRALPFRRTTFDLVVCGLAVGDLGELASAIAEAARVLRSRGWLVYSDLHPGGARAGWQRTFEDERGRQWAVRHHVHDIADHLAACRDAGLVVDAVHEPLIAVPHRFFGWPAALVIRARRAN